MLARRVSDELQATGMRPQGVLTGVDALTARERRVAEMAAERMTSRQIAQELFVTVKTVESHLTQVYEKLDITSREALGPALGLNAGART